MTISAAYSPPTYTGNGATTAFSTVFPFFAATDLVVTRITIATAAETVLALTTDYTVTGGSGAAGTVTTVATLSSAYQLRIERFTPRTQATDFQDTGEFPIGTLETQMDKLVLVEQELAHDVALAATEAYVDAAVLVVQNDVTALQADVTTAENAATAAAASAAAAAQSAADVAASIAAGGLSGSPVSAAMEPVVAAATLALARTEMGLDTLATLGYSANITWTGNHTFNTGTVTFSNGATVSALLAGTSATFSTTLGVTGAATFGSTVAITGAITAAAIGATTGTFSGVVSANAGLTVAGAALNTPAEVDVASASTIDLDAALSNKIRVTGTTAITGVTLSNGRFRFVRFAGALTLTHGASLILPTAANITTAAGDCAVLMGEAAGVVRCIGYQKANGQPLAGGGGKVAQVVRATWSTYTSFTNATPLDNTIPQNTEGAERFTASITPTNASSNLLIEVELQCHISLSVAAGDDGVLSIIGHLHKDSDANAIAAAVFSKEISPNTAVNLIDAGANTLRIVAYVSAGGTSAITFKVRSGRATSGTIGTAVTAHNGIGGALFGGVMISSMTITEISP